MKSAIRHKETQSCQMWWENDQERLISKTNQVNDFEFSDNWLDE